MSTHPCSRPCSVTFVVPIVVAPRTAFEFAGRKHRAIGAESCIAACKRLEPRKDRAPQTASRYAIECGNLREQALIYGQGAAVSGSRSRTGPTSIHWRRTSGARFIGTRLLVRSRRRSSRGPLRSRGSNKPSTSAPSRTTSSGTCSPRDRSRVRLLSASFGFYGGLGRSKVLNAAGGGFFLSVDQ
jgi:hypothetical protein